MKILAGTSDIWNRSLGHAGEGVGGAGGTVVVEGGGLRPSQRSSE